VSKPGRCGRSTCLGPSADAPRSTPHLPVEAGQREVEDRTRCRLRPWRQTATISSASVRSIRFDPCGNSEIIDVKGNCQVFLNHRERTCALLRLSLSIRVDDRLLDQLLEPTLAGRPTDVSPLTKCRSPAGPSRHCRRDLSPKPRGSSPVVSGYSSPKLGQSVKFFARANNAGAPGRAIGRDVVHYPATT
jgi:hypothetical protein